MDERKAKSSETGLSDSEAEISVLPSDVREALLAKVGALHRQVDELTVFVKHKVPSASGLIQRAEEAGAALHRLQWEVERCRAPEETTDQDLTD